MYINTNMIGKWIQNVFYASDSVILVEVNNTETYGTTDEVTADITAGQNKSSEETIVLQYARTPAGPVV